MVVKALIHEVSEPSTEEDSPMLRIRLASVAVALGMMFTLPGCFFHDGPLFPRINNFFHGHHDAPCECHAGHLPPELHGQNGPILMGPGQTMPTITTVPAASQPNVFKGPSATTTPYFPPN